MLRLRNDNHQTLKIDYQKTKEYAIQFKELVEGQKISLMSNEMFKTMFCNSKNIKYGAKLLSYILDMDYEDILKSIRILNNEVNKDKILNKSQRCDYVVQIKDTLCNVEVNCNATIETLLRNLMYANKWFTKDISVGSIYHFTPVICVNLNNFAFVGSDKVMETFYIQNDEHTLLTDKIIFVNVSIPNLRRKCYTQGIESLDEFERYILGLIETDIDIARQIGMDDEFMQESISKQIEMCMTEDLRESYDHELAMQEEFKRQGLEEGQASIVKKMLENGISKEEISKMTNIPLKDIEKMIQ